MYNAIREYCIKKKNWRIRMKKREWDGEDNDMERGMLEGPVRKGTRSVNIDERGGIE
jgi:hypothetical protein